MTPLTSRSVNPVFSIYSLAAFVFAVMVSTASIKPCQAQSAVLSEIYGRGVHAYNSGRYDQATQWLTMAIDNGFEDPRGYYFRGLAAHASGRSYEAESDFEQGAKVEARLAYDDLVGRSLTRVQGPIRIKLEQTREKARLEALAAGLSRSKARYGELGVDDTVAPAASVAPRNVPNAPPPRPRAVTPPAAPATSNPFADDMGQDAEIDSLDAFEGVMENAQNEPAGGAKPAPPSGGANPFDAGGAAGADPFNSGAPASDPFATPGGADPFSGSPF